MKIQATINKLPKSEVEIKITVPEEIMATSRKKACEDLSKEVKVKGFRPGHVPGHILEEYVGKDYIDAHAQELAIQRAYAEAVIAEKIEVVSRPKVKIESEEPLVFTATVAVMPEVEVKDHKSIKVKKDEVKVSEKDVEDVLKDLKKHGTIYKDVDREAKKGDRVEINFEGFDKDDKPVENTKSKNHPVIIGGDSLIPGFEDELIGLKKEEKKEFNITFPKDYGKKDLQNKELKFKVEMLRIEEAHEPELNEDFIEKMTGQKISLDQLKQDIEKNIQLRKEEESKQKQENEYLEELLKKTKVELPEGLIDEETHGILHDMKHDISDKGLEFNKFLEQAKITEEELLKKYRPEAEKRLKVRLALQHVIKEEKIEVTAEDIKAELDRIKSFYPEKEHDKIEQDFANGELQGNVANRLTLRKFFEKVLS